MDIILQKIRGLQDKKNISTKKLASNIGVTPQTIYDYFSEKSQISIKNLRKIAEVFSVPVGYFFDEKIMVGDIIGSQNGNGNRINIVTEKCNSLEKEIEGLKEQLKLKDEIIELLKNNKK